MRALRRLCVALLLTCTGVLVAPSAAQADGQAPQLDSFAMATPATVGGGATVAMDYAAHDDGWVGVASFHWHPVGDDTRGLVASYHANSGKPSGRASMTLSSWQMSGRYELRSVELTDGANNHTRYGRDGSVTTYPSGAAAPPSATFDFAAADFTVENPNQDTTGPLLSSARLLSSTVVAGEPVVVLYTASDDRSGIERVHVDYTTPTGASIGVGVYGVLAGVGPASWASALSAPAGSYVAQNVALTDRAGRHTLYRRDGVVQQDGAGDSPPVPLDVASLDVDVVSPVEDRAVPTLTGLTRSSDAVIHPGDRIALRYAAADAGTGVALLEAQYRDPVGHEWLVQKRCGSLNSGTATRDVPLREELGAWTLQSVRLVDRMGNQATYLRDGTVRKWGPDADGPTTHHLDLAAADFELAAGSPTYETGPATRDTYGEYCPSTPHVSLAGPTTAVPGSSTITVAGTVTRDGKVVPAPVVAVYADPDRAPRLLAVVRGGSTGRYAATTRLTRDTSFRAHFLGAYRSLPADPRASTAVTARVGIKQSAAVSVSATSVRLTRSVVVRGRVAPGRSNVLVRLQVPQGTGWRTVRSARTTSTGMVAWTMTPVVRGTQQYRVYVPADARYLGTVSASVSVRVV